MQPVISVNNLCKQFKDLTAVDNLSFTVNRDDIYGFLGQNGAGKSTTIRMLLTLIAPTAGKIEMFGKDLKTNRADILKNVGAVIEKPDLYKYLTAYQNLSIFAKMSGVKPTKDLLMQQLEMVGLAERAQSKVKTFSQGMKQRLGIAVALIHNPQLIILDEPTNGLDPQGIADMRNLILTLSKKMGKTVVISSHLLSEIQLIANRMLIINKGQKMAEGNVAELMDPSQTIVTITTTNDDVTKTKLLSSDWSGLVLPESGIKLRMDKKQIPSLNEFLVQMNTGVLSIEPKHSLEDYFLSLTNEHGHVEAFTN